VRKKKSSKKAKSKQKKCIEVGCAIIEKHGKILIAQRRPGDFLGGYWEFPGGKRRDHGNIIYEIDGRPAYDMLLESLTEIEFENPHQIFQRIFLGLPTRDFQTDFTRSNYLIRNITGVNAKKGVLTCVTPVEVGDFMTFTVRDAERARHDLLVTLKDLKERFGSTKPAFGFYFNCCARGEALYGRLNEDTKFIRQFFPDVPILGIFAYGELSPVDHVNHLHHYSGALTLVSES